MSAQHWAKAMPQRTPAAGRSGPLPRRGQRQRGHHRRPAAHDDRHVAVDLASCSRLALLSLRVRIRPYVELGRGRFLAIDLERPPVGLPRRQQQHHQVDREDAA